MQQFKQFDIIKSKLNLPEINSSKNKINHEN